MLQGWFRGWHLLQAGKAVELNFHTKGELQRMKGGAGQPPLGRPAWGSCHLAPTFSGWLGFSLGVGCELLDIFHVIPRRPTSPRAVGLALAHLGPLLPCHVDPGSCDAPQVSLGLG